MVLDFFLKKKEILASFQAFLQNYASLNPRVAKKTSSSVKKETSKAYSSLPTLFFCFAYDKAYACLLITPTTVEEQFVSDLSSFKEHAKKIHDQKAWSLYGTHLPRLSSTEKSLLFSLAKKYYQDVFSQEQIFHLLESMMFVIGKDKRIHWANKKAQEYFQQFIVGKRCYHTIYNYNQSCKHCLFKQKQQNLVLERLLADKTLRQTKSIRIDDTYILEILEPLDDTKKKQREIAEKDKQLRALVQLSTQIMGFSSYQRILKSITKTLVERFTLPFAFLLLYEKQTRTPFLYTYEGTRINKERFERWLSSFFAKKSLVDQLFEQAEKKKQMLFLLRDFYNSYGVAESIRKSSHGQDPLTDDLLITHFSTKSPYDGLFIFVKYHITADDKQINKTITRLIAKAIENLYYRNSLKQKIRDMDHLTAIAKKMTSASLYHLMKEILDLALERTKAVSGSIMIVNHDEHRLETIYARGRGIRKNFKNITFAFGEGAAGTVAKEGKMLIIHDKVNDPRYINVGTKTSTKNAYIGIPLKFRRSVLGVLNIDFRNEKDVTDDVLTFLTILSNNASVAIRNNQLYNHYVMRVKRLSAMYDIAKVIAATLDFEKVLDVIAQIISKLMKADVCSILLLNKNKNHLTLRAIYPSTIKIPHARVIPLEKTLSGRSVKEKKILYVEEVLKEPNYFARQFARKYKLKSLLTVPLLIEDEVIGLINIYTKKIRKYYSGEIDLLEGIADMAAIAIEKSLLYHRIKKDKEILSLISQVSSSLNSTLDLDKLLELILKETVTITHSDRGALLLEENGYLSMKKIYGYPEHFKHFKVKIGEGITGLCFHTAKPIIVHNVKEEPSYIPGDQEELSEAAFPLILRGKPIGVLNLESKQLANYERYKELLTILMEKFAVAIENASLHKRALEFNKRLKEEVNKATKHLQEANERLKRLDKIKDEFLSNVSHELRTPLTSIKGYSQLLASERLGMLNETQRESLQIIIKEADRLTRLINDILDLSKMEAGKIKPSFKKQSLTALIQDSIEHLLPLANEKKIRLTAILEQLPEIAFDADLLMRVFDNLIGNALKFTPQGGKVIVEAKDKEPYIEVSVSDTGQGIPQEQLKKIFDKFYQVDPTLTKATPGTGLGLSIVKNIVHMHKGKITVQSTLGKGSTFTFTIYKYLME